MINYFFKSGSKRASIVKNEKVGLKKAGVLKKVESNELPI
jgi:hypothetical protein